MHKNQSFYCLLISFFLFTQNIYVEELNLKTPFPINKKYSGKNQGILRYDHVDFEIDLFKNFNKKSPAINPKIESTGIRFYYYDLYAKSIYLKSDFDNWYYKYPFKKKYKNNLWQGIWVLNLPFNEKSFQLKKGKYHYKLIVNGFFTYDKYNHNKKPDGFGNFISFFNINQDLIHFNQLHSNPIQSRENPNLFRFIFKGRKDQRVYLLGNFNHWNPYSHPLVYKANGIWEIELILPRGEYYYHFIVNNQYRKDILNPSRDANYPDFSYFKVEK